MFTFSNRTKLLKIIKVKVKDLIDLCYRSIEKTVVQAKITILGRGVTADLFCM